MVFHDDSHLSADRLGYFDDFSLASRYLDSVECRPSRRSLYHVSYSQFLNELPAYPFSVHLVTFRRMRLLGRFDTLQHADDFVHFYKSEFPFIKLVISDHGMQTSSLDTQSTLF